MRKGHVPGLALAVFDKGKVVYLNGFGMRDVGKNLPMRTDTVLYAASLTKSTFATMVMGLVDEGVIALDRPVAEQLAKPIGQYAEVADLADDPRFVKITPRMLLSHTSGLPNVRWFLMDGRTDEHAKLATHFEPGERYAYSGEGINLLGILVAEKTGKMIGELMKERIFDRFGMSRTSMTWQPQFESETAMGYDEASKLLGHSHQRRPRPAGSMDTTIADFSRFLEGVLRGEGLSWSSREMMLSPQVRIHSLRQFPTLRTETTENDPIQLSYGLGWGIFRTPFGKAFFKEGHIDGTENYCELFPESGRGIVIMTNSSNGESIFRDLLANVIGDRWTPWKWNDYVPAPGL